MKTHPNSNATPVRRELVDPRSSGAPSPLHRRPVLTDPRSTR